MRNIPSSVINQITAGSEPVFVVAIQWSSTLTEFYATKDNILDYKPYVKSVGDIENVNTLGGGSATSFEVTFDDTTGHFKGLFDTQDIHFKPISIYQYFDGMGSGLYLIFQGQISSPIVWSESSRVLTVQAITRRANIEVGFSPEEGVFPEIHESLLGQPFPLGFGKPIHVPALALQQVPTGQMTDAFGILDPTLQLQINKLTQEWGNKINYGMAAAQYAALAFLSGDESLAEQWNQISTEAQNQATDIQNDIHQLQQVKIQQEAYAKTVNYVIGGYKFPQGRRVKVKINEFMFWAVFHGKEGDYLNDAPDNFDQKCRVTLTPIIPPILQVLDNQTGELKFQQGSFTFIQAGAQITLIDDYPIDWVVNCIDSDITAVYAYRSFNGKKELTLVPDEYYDVIHYNWTGHIQPTVIRMKRPLSLVSYFENLSTTRAEDYANLVANTNGTRVLPHIVNNVDWDDQIYVTYESSVGPDIVDILIHLIETYTDYTYDTTTFNAVRADLEDYPANFCLFDRPLVDDLIEQIAYQARCRVWLKDGKYFIKYLPRKETPVDTIDLDSIEEDSFTISVTPTEEIVTKYVATWQTDYVKPPNRIILRYNAGLRKYGIQEATYDYFIYNARELVEKVATFWMIRSSNSWKRVDCVLHLGKINLETNDTITIDTPYLSCEGILEGVEYNLDDYSIRVSIWTPVRLGESTEYQFAWPADISVTTFFPTFNEITSGAAGGFNQGINGQFPKFGQIDSVYIQNRGNTRSDRPRDYGTQVLSDSSSPDAATTSTPTNQPFLVESYPNFNYAYNIVPPNRAPADTVLMAVYPGEIVSGSGDTYTVKIWKQGMSEASTNVEAKQMMIDPSDQIPATTKCHVVMNTTKSGTKEYTIQVPVWTPEP
jgi:hypothetical protein